jgi:hypothetical protein
MRYVLILLLAIHAVAHLPGFAVAWRFMTSPDLPYRSTILQGRVDLGPDGIRLFGLLWLALALAWTVVAVGVATRAAWWLVSLECVAFVSLLACIVTWPDTKFGIIANLLAVVLAFAAIAFPGVRPALRNTKLESLWDSSLHAQAAPTNRHAPLPSTAGKLLQASGAAAAPHAHSVRLTMHGEIRLGRWFPFHAEQVITADGQFIWAGTVSIFGIPIRGADQLLSGLGGMEWKLLDCFPLVQAAGTDITKSAAGRFQGEALIFLPGLLLMDKISMQEEAPGALRFQFHGQGADEEIRAWLTIDGQWQQMQFARWGNPDNRSFRAETFGALLSASRRFSTFIIPTHIRAGWYPGTPRFDQEGEFFRATITDAVWR